MRKFLYFTLVIAALGLVAVGCESDEPTKNEQTPETPNDGEEPEEPNTPEEPEKPNTPEEPEKPNTPEEPEEPNTPEEPQPEYVMDVALAVAMRIPSREIGLADNYYALAFADDAENVELGVVLAGAVDDEVLQAGTYDSSNETLLAAVCEMFVYEPEGEYTFTSGCAVVTLASDTYGFDIELTGEDGGIYHFTYEGVVLDMETEEPEVSDFVPVAVKAYREASWEVGNFELGLYIDAKNYHALDMFDKIAPNDNYLSAGVYRMSDGTIGKWSNIVANVTTGEGAAVADAEIELVHNADGTSTLSGFMVSVDGQRIDVDWTGTIEGFNFGGE